MPAIDPIRIQKSPAGEDRIRELKARATEALDNAMDVVAENLGRTDESIQLSRNIGNKL